MNPANRLPIVAILLCVLLGLLLLLWSLLGQAPERNVSQALFDPLVVTTIPEELRPTLDPEMAQEVALEPTPEVTPTPRQYEAAPDGVFTFLLLGVDRRSDQAGLPAKTDAIMLVRVDFDRKNASIISIPRDLWIPIADLNYYDIYNQRINAAYYFGEKYQMPGGGIAILRKTILQNYGIYVDRYMLINFEALVEVVDALGGIEVYVHKDIYDWAMPLNDYDYMEFSLDQGWHDMDGITALRYARTRHQDSDTERVKRQQDVLMAIYNKALKANTITRIPELFEILSGSYETDITPAEAIWFAKNADGLTQEDVWRYSIDQTMVVGHVTGGGAHVWLPKEEPINALFAEFAKRKE